MVSTISSKARSALGGIDLGGIDLMPFTDAHLDGGVALSAAEGWAHGRADWALSLAVSRGVAALSRGRVVGTTLRSDFGPRLSTVNMVLVEAGHRGRGLGRAVMEAAIGSEARALRLVATHEGRPLYEKLGFETVGEIACMQGVVTDAQTHLELRDATDEDLAEIAALESASFGGDRAEMIAQLAGCARIALLGAQGDLRGFAACRAFGRGHVIGPVVAPDAQAGLALIAHLAQPLIGRPLRVDVLAQAGLEPGLAKMGLTSEYRVPVMQRGDQSIGGDRLALLSQGLC